MGHLKFDMFSSPLPSVWDVGEEVYEQLHIFSLVGDLLVEVQRI